MSSRTSEDFVAVLSQFNENRDLNLLGNDVELYARISPTFHRFLRENCGIGGNSDRIDLITRAAALECIDRILKINPYVEVCESDRHALTEIYRSTYLAIESGESVEETLSVAHYPSLRNWLASLLPQSLVDSLQFSPTIGSVTYSQYSADMQMKILMLHPASMKGSVLDIGCGKTGSLVGALRKRGINATGIDRQIDTDTPYLYEMSWFDYTFAPERYSLIISHLAFSSHFVFHQNTRSDHLDSYRRLYLRILDALDYDGGFVYVPSLPKIEETLPGDRYTVERWNASARVEATRISRITPRGKTRA